ncbi:MAG: phosphate/phosphite/phosphonate ABC transporter substrate-binding protein [Deltaproteobacteria bacterium]|nr:phosphate/phosphite/phosphonate ABC transporter substrate-binding protein [Deltaproteobacteria bacterium]
MRRCLFACQLLLCILIAAVIFGSVGCEPISPVRGKAKILVHPGPFSFLMMEARFIFLMDYLTKETSWEMDMVCAPPEMESLTSLVETERFALSLVNPYYYLILKMQYGAVPLVKAVSLDGRTEYRGLIIIHPKSPIGSINDLRGKSVLASSRSNVCGFLAQWMHLKECGLEPERDVKFIFGDTQEEIFEKIALGQAEVGFVREDVLQALTKAKGAVPNVTVLAITQYYPNPCFVSFPDADSDLVRNVKTALLQLDLGNASHRFILERLRISGFAPASADDYREFEDLLVSYGLFSAPFDASHESGVPR